jgi:hypothetical protein
MKRLIVLILLSIVRLCPVAPASETNAPAVHTLEQLVAEYVTLRSLIADETRNWREQERTWKAEIELLKTEEKSIQKDIDESRDFETSFQETRAQLLDRKETLKAVLTGIQPHVERAEAELKTWQKQIPPSLLPGLNKAFAELPASREDAARLSLTRRIQLVVALFTQIETLQHNIHSARELLNPGSGSQREMDVIYVGLARGFAVSADNRVAAIGTPTPTGWVWLSSDALAPDIRRTIRLFNKETTAELVNLPLQVRPPATRQEAK